MALAQEEVEARLKEAIALFVGTRITKENLAKALKPIITQIVREQAEKEPEPMLELYIALGPDGKILCNPPEQSLAND